MLPVLQDKELVMRTKLIFALCWKTPPALLKSLVQVSVHLSMLFFVCGVKYLSLVWCSVDEIIGL